MFGRIYRVKNKINGKQYIGQTVKSITERWQTHCSEAKKNLHFNRHLQSAIRKYGRENFSVEEICEAATPEELDRLEMKLIAEIPIALRYNMTVGGQSSTRLDPKTTKKYWNDILASFGLSDLDSTEFDETEDGLRHKFIFRRN